jgi:hypothetical protein
MIFPLAFWNILKERCRDFSNINGHLLWGLVVAYSISNISSKRDSVTARKCEMQEKNKSSDAVNDIESCMHNEGDLTPRNLELYTRVGDELAELTLQHKEKMFVILLNDMLRSKKVRRVDAAKFAEYIRIYEPHRQLSRQEVYKAISIANIVIGMYKVFREAIEISTTDDSFDVSEISVDGRHKRCSNPNCCQLVQDYDSVQHVTTMALYLIFLRNTSSIS